MCKQLGRHVAKTIAVCNTKEIVWINENITNQITSPENLYVEKINVST